MEFTKENLDKFLLEAVGLGLSEKECEKALIIKGWPEKFIKKYCKKHYEMQRRKIRREDVKKEDQEEKYEKEHVYDREVEKINQELAKLR